MKLFIPEKFVLQKQILVSIPGHGYGVLIEPEELGKKIKEGVIHKTAVANREVIPVTGDKYG